MDLSVFFAGTGGSAPTAHRGLPAALLRRGGEKVLVDCGEGTQRQLMSTIGLPDVEVVLLTHHHLDHWLGLPGLLKSYDLRDRAASLEVYGPPGTRALLRSLERLVGRLHYPFAVHDLEPSDEVRLDGWTVHPLRVAHRIPAYGYAFVEDPRPGRFDAERALQLGVAPGPDFGVLQRGGEVGGVTAEQVTGPPRAGRKVVLSGDTAPCDMVRIAAHGADVLVHEATFTSDQRDRALETGHSTAAQAAMLAADAEVRMLALVHKSMRHAAREIKAEAREHFPDAVVPRDFDTIDVPFPEKGGPELVHWPDGREAPAGAPR